MIYPAVTRVMWTTTKRLRMHRRIGQQKNWEGLLVHNFADCHGLRHITKMATAALNS